MDDDIDENVQPPVKRRRLLESELTEEELLRRKEENDLNLKARFESIFEKYGKDFDGVGDEIDLETGQIVVDNGHLIGMTNEQDAGDLDDISDEQESDESSDEDRMLTSTLLSQFRQRLEALDSGGVPEDPNDAQLSHESSEDEDSLMGNADLGDEPQESSMKVVPPHRPRSITRSLGEEIMQADKEGNKMQILSNDANHHPLLTPRRKVDLHSMPVEPIWRSPSLPKAGNRPVGKEHVRPTHTNFFSASLKAPSHLSSRRITSDRQPDEMGDPTAARTFWSYSYFPKVVSSEGHKEANPSQDTKSREVEEVEPCQNPPPKRIKPTRIRWTEEENALLSRLKLDIGMNYDEAAKYFPDRPKKAVVRHWIRLVKKIKDPHPQQPKVTTRIRWTAAEDAQLRRLMADPNLTLYDVAGHFADRSKSFPQRHWTRIAKKDQRENNDQMGHSPKSYFSDEEQQPPSSEEADSDSSDGKDVSSLPAQTPGRPLSSYCSDSLSHSNPASTSTGKPLAYAISDNSPSRVESSSAVPKEAPSKNFQQRPSTGDPSVTLSRPAVQGKRDQDRLSRQQNHNCQKSDQQAALSDTETRRVEDGQGDLNKIIAERDPSS